MEIFFVKKKKSPKCRNCPNTANAAGWRRWGTHRETGRGTRRSARMFLPPGVTAKRCLRGFKVDILVHARWIVVRRAVTRFRENNQRLNLELRHSANITALLTRKRSERRPCWIWIWNWSSEDIWCWNIPSLLAYSSAQQHKKTKQSF